MKIRYFTFRLSSKFIQKYLNIYNIFRQLDGKRRKLKDELEEKEKAAKFEEMFEK